tara:strand:+ start:209 stop:1624 length:1416 start_codon:yes stop_codon:yes gene_type:complete
MGEDKETYSVLFTHQHRLKCMLKKIFPRSDRTCPIRKFQNGCILKLVIQRQEGTKDKNKIDLFLIHKGSIDPHELSKNNTIQKYHNEEDTKRLHLTGPVGLLLCDREMDNNELKYIFRNSFGQKFGTEEKFVFYLIRHAQAEHNLWGKKGFLDLKKMKQISPGDGYKDTSLTGVGIEQSETTSVYFLNILKRDMGSRFVEGFKLYVFCSELKRTYQTAAIVLKPLLQTAYLDRIKINILPCSSEVNSKHPGISQGDCDSSTGYDLLTPNENMSLCKDETKRSSRCCEKTDTIGCVPNLFYGTLRYLNDTYLIDWSFYDRIMDSNLCTSDNMINLALQFIVEDINDSKQNKLKYEIIKSPKQIIQSPPGDEPDDPPPITKLELDQDLSAHRPPRRLPPSGNPWSRFLPKYATKWFDISDGVNIGNKRKNKHTRKKKQDKKDTRPKKHTKNKHTRKKKHTKKKKKKKKKHLSK